MKKCMIMACVVILTVGLNASASIWNQDVSSGAKWSEAGSWTGGVPGSSDTAIFNQTQANTLDVDVDVAGQTRLMQVQQNHTFNGTGSINLTAAPASHFQNIMYNTAASVAYNVDVNVKTTTGFYGQSRNNNGGTTTFNASYTLDSGSLMNFIEGTRVFNGDLTIDGSLRLGSGTMVIGGSGTTSISSDYISTAGAGTELHLNRAGAYTLADPSSGYMRVERTQIHFGAALATGAGTDVRMYGSDVNSALVSDGDFDQSFGWLDCEGVSRFDMGNTDSMWTFEDSSSQVWDPTGDGELVISNVDADNTVIRFAINGGTGLTEEQVGQINLNGSALTLEDTTVDGGYFYITQAIPEPATFALLGISGFVFMAYRRFILIS